MALEALLCSGNAHPHSHAVGIKRQESWEKEKNNDVLLAGRLEPDQNMIFGQCLANAKKKMIGCKYWP
jgi:hypothetical protein